MRHDKVLACHYLVNLTVDVSLEAQVAVGDDADELVVAVNHRDTADMVLLHYVERILHGLSTHDGYRIVNHTVLSSLYDSHLSCLLLYRHVLVYYADATLTGYCYCHRSLSHGVHSGCDERNLQVNVA